MRDSWVEPWLTGNRQDPDSAPGLCLSSAGSEKQSPFPARRRKMRETPRFPAQEAADNVPTRPERPKRTGTSPPATGIQQADAPPGPGPHGKAGDCQSHALEFIQEHTRPVDGAVDRSDAQGGPPCEYSELGEGNGNRGSLRPKGMHMQRAKVTAAFGSPTVHCSDRGQTSVTLPDLSRQQQVPILSVWFIVNWQRPARGEPQTMQEAERTTGEEEEALTLEERAEVLDDYITEAVEKGWRVETRGNFLAVVVSRRRVNHVLHAILSVFTGGVWLPVWAGVSIFGGEKRALINVDPKGDGSFVKL